MVIIRDARTSEHAALSRLAHLAKASWGYPDAWLADWSEALTITAEYVRTHRVWVAEADGEPVGLIALEMGSPPEIGHLWVHPAKQGQGVGKRLVDHLTEAAREAGITELHIVADPNAVPFYEKCGARVFEEIPAPVLGEERFLPLMRLSLTRYGDQASESTPDLG